MSSKSLIENIIKYVEGVLSPLEWHYYHSFEHAIDVMNRAKYLWEKENISKSELEILMIAAVFHDTWFIVQYDNNEAIWAKIAKNYLKTIWYQKSKITEIEKLIMATDPWYKEPKNLLESIIKDSDLDNLWRDDFFDKAEKIKKELEVIKWIEINEHDWYHSVLDLMCNHKYHTKTQNSERNEKKDENKKVLKDIIIKMDRDDFKNYWIEL